MSWIDEWIKQDENYITNSSNKYPGIHQPPKYTAESSQTDNDTAHTLELVKHNNPDMASIKYLKKTYLYKITYKKDIETTIKEHTLKNFSSALF
jgi:hypothetical protein